MAINRLYIVNKKTLEYVCIAKCNDYNWDFGNESLLNKLLLNTEGINNDDNLLIGSELDEGFYEKYLKNGVNINHENTWNYFNENIDNETAKN